MAAVRAIGVEVGDAGLVSLHKGTGLLRRFFWALNDESGAVPWGVPEAIGEILALRPELQETFLPLPRSLLTEQDMVQAAGIERGAVWALGPVGPSVARCELEPVDALRVDSETHPEAETREPAKRSIALLASADASP